MFGVNVKDNVREFTRALNRFQRRQIPFAVSQALNGTIFDVRKRIVGRTFPRSFDIKNRRYPSATMRVEKASKRRLKAALFDRLARNFLARQAKGGTKRPVSGTHIAVPQAALKRTTRGAVRKGQRPRAILDKPDTFKGKLRRGTPAIFRRVGTKRRRLKMLYVLTPQVRIKKRFPFYEDAARTAKRAFPHRMRQSWRKALATAR